MNALYVFTLITCLTWTGIKSDGECGDWDLFADEYYNICYKIVPDQLADYATAQAACLAMDGASLPTIHTQAQQDFLTNLLFTKHKITDGVWIDAKVKSTILTWADGTTDKFNNWVQGRPVDVTDVQCVETVNDKAPDNMGKWLDSSCSKKNAVICEKVVLWSPQKTQRMIADDRRLIKAGLF
ncbi:unnamed protein product [Medioppia subpectinata]|uniref:C-type lectin domain-containing protein n=1 Tax=Medioppia subpectinata TaxID=1979941 RepID=A0A7R9Q184_9ACAR|nr:unnamed protein product [Medioppia subpectinata]CAG2108954.1 unnamed protein product [Medioppia subpectinata]